MIFFCFIFAYLYRGGGGGANIILGGVCVPTDIVLLTLDGVENKVTAGTRLGGVIVSTIGCVWVATVVVGGLTLVPTRGVDKGRFGGGGGGGGVGGGGGGGDWVVSCVFWVACLGGSG